MLKVFRAGLMMRCSITSQICLSFELLGRLPLRKKQREDQVTNKQPKLACEEVVPFFIPISSYLLETNCFDRCVYSDLLLRLLLRH
jgi:hypothetical protein